jgi:hypothetical protein
MGKLFSTNSLEKLAGGQINAKELVALHLIHRQLLFVLHFISLILKKGSNAISHLNLFYFFEIQFTKATTLF